MKRRADALPDTPGRAVEGRLCVADLVVSEKATNAIRYGAYPVGLRPSRDRILVCEVSG